MSQLDFSDDEILKVCLNISEAAKKIRFMTSLKDISCRRAYLPLIFRFEVELNTSRLNHRRNFMYVYRSESDHPERRFVKRLVRLQMYIY